jgi:uncharacterized protein (TIGR00269 family)
MKCINCNNKAVIRIRRHNSSFCKTHFNEFFINQVKKIIKKYRMFDFKDKIMVCVSGGKDSMVLWKVLDDLGYNTFGMYINLGISDYSEKSKTKVINFSKINNLECKIIDLEENNISVESLASDKKRAECSVCGIIKRYYFNKIAYDLNLDIIATGHNLDDESSRLLGNFIHWHKEYLPKQTPVLDSDNRMLKKKVKPLISLTEQEVAAYAFLNRIDYLNEECPMSKGATSMIFKEALNKIENEMPGTKQFFYFQFQKEREKFIEKTDVNNTDNLVKCKICGFENFQEVCTFCKLTNKG